MTASVSFIDALIAAGVSAAFDQDEQPFLLPEPGTLSLISSNGLAGKIGTQSSEYSALEHRQGRRTGHRPNRQQGSIEHCT